MEDFEIDFDNYLTTSEIQDKYSISRSTLYRWEKKGLLGEVKRTPGGHRRYTTKQIERAIKIKNGEIETKKYKEEKETGDEVDFGEIIETSSEDEDRPF